MKGKAHVYIPKCQKGCRCDKTAAEAIHDTPEGALILASATPIYCTFCNNLVFLQAKY